MVKTGGDYDLIIISKDKAGMEAAKEAARLGKTALILKLNPGSIASVMCSTSINSSPGEGQEGVEADRLHLVEDRETGKVSFCMERLNADARHSVYILQGEEEAQAVNPTHEWTPETPSLSPIEEASMLEGNEGTDSDPENKGDERDWFKETLRERDIRTRNKLLHRPSSGGKKEKPESTIDKPTFRKREMNFRKRMTREYRQPAGKEKENLPSQESSTKMSFHSQVQPFSSSKTENHARRNQTNQAPSASVERRQPFSSSVIPMDQSRWKNKQSARSNEADSSESSRSQPIPGPMIWEANEGTHKTKRGDTKELEASRREHQESRQRSSLSPPSNDYQPFQRSKESPSRTQGRIRSSKEPPPRTDRSVSTNRGLPITSEYGRDWSSRKPAGPLSRKQVKKEEIRPVREVSSPAPLSTTSIRDGDHPFMNQEAARHILRNTSHLSQEQGLKRDSIDIEDPYGQSYEDFMEPFHGSSQDHQLEKRKLALRGLHNLINNLG